MLNVFRSQHDNAIELGVILPPRADASISSQTTLHELHIPGQEAARSPTRPAASLPVAVRPAEVYTGMDACS